MYSHLNERKNLSNLWLNLDHKYKHLCEWEKLQGSAEHST